MPSTLVFSLLAQAARHEVHCNCSDVVRVQVGPFLVPVGPVTVVFGLLILVLAPVKLYALWCHHHQERRAREVMEDL